MFQQLHPAANAASFIGAGLTMRTYGTSAAVGLADMSPALHWTPAGPPAPTMFLHLP